MIPLFESTNIWHISNWRNLFKVPIRPIDTNCNLILWIDFGAYRSLIEWKEIMRVYVLSSFTETGSRWFCEKPAWHHS